MTNTNTTETNTYIFNLRKRVEEKRKFVEIDAEAYNWSLDALPPAKIFSNGFFIGEPYFADVFPVCVRWNGKFFRAYRHITENPQDFIDEIKML